MIKKKWLISIFIFLITGIGTFFIFQQIFNKETEAIPVTSHVSTRDIEVEVKEVHRDEESDTNIDSDGSKGNETEYPKEEEESLSNDDVKDIVSDLFEGILFTYRDLGTAHNWSNRSNPADFELLKPELLQYASKSFTDGHLKELSSKYYCECDAPLIPFPSLDVRFTVVESNSNKIVASSIEFSNELHGDNGGTIYFTVIKENEIWVMDGWSKVSPEKEDMKVTWQEYEAYVGKYNDVTFLNEVNGGKVYVFFNHDANWLNAVDATNTNSIYDIPIDWIPIEYRKPPYYIKSIEGIWRHESYSGGFEISNVSGNVFDFQLNVISSGGNVGELEGMAVVDGTKGIFNELEHGCELIFELGTDSIEVTENTGCTAWHGSNMSFEGVYKRE
ncbi:hypothetical protein [Sutcliffiella halmapala]|uniref:hypothetical protein n=1 Tax=Sutcliffiella halmapala TaxID=79882 RepID=UPI0009956715|nr:hypothetical protein [Sutcliffiella halmapala]